MKFIFYNYFPLLSNGHIIDSTYKHRKVHHNYPNFDVNNIKENDFVFVKNDKIDFFFTNYFPKIKNKFNLITAVGDIDTTNKYLKFANSEKINKWIGTNIIFSHHKIIKVPIGFQENELPGGDQNMLDELHNKSKKIDDKENKVYVTYINKNTHSSRNNLYDKLKNKNFIVIENNCLDFKQYMENINNYKFVICPRGRGADTHRFYEVMLMNSIPIVEKSGLDDLYNKFPCIIIDDFKNITNEILDNFKIDEEKMKNIEKYLIINNLKSFLINKCK